MSHLLDPIRAQVARIPTIRASVKTLLELLLQKIADAPTMEDVNTIVAEAQGNLDGMADDVIASTPVVTPVV